MKKSCKGKQLHYVDIHNGSALNDLKVNFWNINYIKFNHSTHRNYCLTYIIIYLYYMILYARVL